MDEVIRIAREGVPVGGGSKQADYTFVNLPQVDSAGHATGAGAAYDQAIALADAQLERFVAAQRELGRWGTRTVLLLVSDHSMDTTPEKTSLAERFRAAGIAADAYTIVQNGSASLVYLSDRTDAARFELLKRMREAALGTGNAAAEVTGSGPVSQALYRESNPADGGAANTVDTVHPAWRLSGPRVGDLVVTHAAGGAFSDPINPLAGNHGGPQTRDNFMALIGPASMVQQATPPGQATPGYDDTESNPSQAENVDVAPTVARLLGFGPPRDSQGRTLGEGLNAAGLPLPPRLGLAPSPRRVRRGRLVRLTFRVTSGGAPVAGARVRLGNRRATAVASGVARLRVRLGRPGLRRVVASHRGYRGGVARIRVVGA
jgi:predicted AlkP superfamily pyrophosphatase or phosphodiesterase